MYKLIINKMRKKNPFPIEPLIWVKARNKRRNYEINHST